MSRFKKAVREGRSSGVPLARVVHGLQRSDRRLRTKAIASAIAGLFALFAISTVMLHYRPWNAVMAAAKSTPVFEQVSAVEPDAGKIFFDTAPAPIELRSNEQIAGLVTNQVAELQGGQSDIPAETRILPPVSVADPAPVDAGADLTTEANVIKSQAAIETSSTLESATRDERGSDPQAPQANLRTASIDLSPRLKKDVLSTGDTQEPCSDIVRRMASDLEVHFPMSSVSISPEYESALRTFAETVARCPTVRVDVGGHTDKIGEQLMNLQLSWQRAENVISYMKRLGLPTGSFSPVGYSSTRPKYSDPMVSSQPRNRRVEFVIR